MDLMRECVPDGCRTDSFDRGADSTVRGWQIRGLAYHMLQEPNLNFQVAMAHELEESLREAVARGEINWLEQNEIWKAIRSVYFKRSHIEPES